MDMNITESSSTPHPDALTRIPQYPPPSSEWVIDMNYLMPFSVMLMILCVLLLILCYLRHRMRQRRQLRHELRLQQMLRGTNDVRRLDEFGLPVLPDRLAMMYPPTYDEATVHNTPMTMHKQTFEPSERPPPYTEYHHQFGAMAPTMQPVELSPTSVSGHTTPVSHHSAHSSAEAASATIPDNSQPNVQS